MLRRFVLRFLASLGGFLRCIFVLDREDLPVIASTLTSVTPVFDAAMSNA
ncbi:MAG: hypothetical protein QOK37_638 [Thermoanaerobaculia bacterium]|nr:hypothetical protein [Thermoanaerobaculia bacterium]